ncbi:MAG: ArsR family transcriptional regulator [Thermoprotei archaeon]|nr:MAG: ArsR family transcriptional regulator [Thermoprotei archaeon]
MLDQIFKSKGRLKVIKVIFKYGEANITKIANETGLSYENVVRHLTELEKLGIIEEVKVGRVRIFRPAWINSTVRYIYNLLKSLNEI